MAGSRTTNTVEEGLIAMLGTLGQLKGAVDGAQWIQQLVTIETTIAQQVQEMRQASQQAMSQQGAGQMGGGPAEMGGPGGGGNPMGGMPGGMGGMMQPTGMGPPGMPGMPGPGIGGLRRSTPGAPDELRRILNAGPG